MGLGQKKRHKLSCNTLYLTVEDLTASLTVKERIYFFIFVIVTLFKRNKSEVNKGEMR